MSKKSSPAESPRPTSFYPATEDQCEPAAFDPHVASCDPNTQSGVLTRSGQQESPSNVSAIYLEKSPSSNTRITHNLSNDHELSKSGQSGGQGMMCTSITVSPSVATLAGLSKQQHSKTQLSSQRSQVFSGGDFRNGEELDDDLTVSSTTEDGGVGVGKGAKVKQAPLWKIMLRESVVSVWLIVILIVVISIQFFIIDEVKKESISTQSNLISLDVRHTLVTFLQNKLKVVQAARYLFRSRQLVSQSMVGHPRYEEVNQTTMLPNPSELQLYEQAIAPYFEQDTDLVAMYMGMSNLQTWKIHRENPPYLSTQLRFAGNVTSLGGEYFERYERRRLFNQSLNDFFLANWQPNKTYLPTAQGWFQDAFAAPYNASTGEYEGVWSGPEFQGTGVGAASTQYGLDPVMVYNLRVDWQQSGYYSVYKLKMLTKVVNEFLRGLELPRNADIVVVNQNGLVAATRQNGDLQVIPDAAEPNNAKKAKVAHITNFPLFSSLATEQLMSVVDPEAPLVLTKEGISIYNIDTAVPGWRIVIYLDGDVLIERFMPSLNALLALCILLILLSLVSVTYSALNVRRQVKASSDQVFSHLLQDLLPGDVAQRCIERTQWPIQDSFDDATVLFADMCNFTRRSSGMTPLDLVSMLNIFIEAFDTASVRPRVEKIKTIGDCYMAVTGVPTRSDTHAQDMLAFAVEMLEIVAMFNDKYAKDYTQEPVAFRIGVHSGALVMGVMGSRRFAFDIFGDTVNVASRIESNGIAGMVRCSEATHDRVKHLVAEDGSASTLGYSFSSPEEIEVKGKEKPIKVYSLLVGLEEDVHASGISAPQKDWM